METGSVLADEECERLVLSFAADRGERGFTQWEAECLVHWAIDARTNNAMLDLVLQRRARVDIIDGSPHFGALVPPDGDTPLTE